MDHSGILRNAKKHRTEATEDVFESVICGLPPGFGLSQRRPWGPGETRSAAAPENESTKDILFFKGVTSTNIVGGIQLLRAHRANLSSPHYSSDKAILNGLIRAGFEIRKNHRTEATEGTEVCGSPFSVRRSVVRSLEFGVRSA